MVVRDIPVCQELLPYVALIQAVFTALFILMPPQKFQIFQEEAPIHSIAHTELPARLPRTLRWYHPIYECALTKRQWRVIRTEIKVCGSFGSPFHPLLLHLPILLSSWKGIPTKANKQLVRQSSTENRHTFVKVKMINTWKEQQGKRLILCLGAFKLKPKLFCLQQPTWWTISKHDMRFKSV